jgi:hypothetical protein
MINHASTHGLFAFGQQQHAFFEPGNAPADRLLAVFLIVITCSQIPVAFGEVGVPACRDWVVGERELIGRSVQASRRRRARVKSKTSSLKV